MAPVIADVVTAVQHDWWAPALAFAAGVVSFASPCVLPLVPGYVLFVSGAEAAGEQRPRARLAPMLLFILGFSLVFTVVFGLAASAVGHFIRSGAGQRAAGVVVVLFGAFMLLYGFRVGMPWVYREGRPLLTRVRPGPAWAFPLGMAFAAGWTPCIGPVLGAIATLAAAQGTTLRAVLLLLMYSAGLGVPFLLVGLGVGRLLRALRVFSRHYRWFAGVSGVLMVALGLLLVSGLWVRLMAPILTRIAGFTPAL